MNHSNRIVKAGRIAAITLVGLAAAPFAQAAGNYYDLGLGIFASGASANGSVAAAYSSGGTFYSWTAATGITSIGGRWDGGYASVSANGSLIGGSAIGTNGNTQAAIYNVASGTWTPLGGIGGSSGTSESSGWGIAGNGSSIVGLGWVNGGTAHAVQSTAGGTLQDLGALNYSSRASVVNFDGSVVAGWQELNSGFWQGTYWKNGVATLMFDGNGDALGEAKGISADGTWVIGGSGSSESWRYNTGTGLTEYLGDYNPDFFTNQGATGISADGKVIVGYDREFGPAQFGTGTIWIEGQGMLNLTEYVTGLGVDLGGRVLAVPLGVSADGMTFYGVDNASHGFVINTTAVVAVPEPSTYAMFGLGLLGVVLARRRKAAAA